MLPQTKFQFQVEGELIQFLDWSKGTPKYVRIAIGEERFPIKLSKSLRREIVDLNIVPGDRLKIIGDETLKPETGIHKLKATRIINLSRQSEPMPDNLEEISYSKKGKSKAKILVCHKSGCLKRGGKHLHEKIEQALSELGLQNHVEIERTGCQKRCKKAPNFILMPGEKETRCDRMDLDSILSFLEKHFCISCK
ncbi:MAG: (2Fe-2S) ferredoxin domain-containing protein [Hydrococcus sp. C42_A2020_068]|uniref:(2Fe-2S) ferredoxin domain-containing protein n=1 Tax=Pleurocapsa sp. PCC 7327 TaxID=118163 RepID=UPI00029FC43E|nr:(2Fe-2S) ferredoxin domain-containing protein [Pleurocapsa sp. PCC 7327]AFY78717.1 hypothetical protein Ple7327_3514 [Pleurocapsa sp. PCC 7327]MBF2018575.1 (2Fe-2S) ferredoxin domain-containing protein [Hydrococcus sp. C42_A2020_068]